MSIKNQIIVASREHFKAHIRKHLTNINVILANPTAIPDHTDVMDAVEKELFIISDYESKLAALDKHFRSEDGEDHETDSKSTSTTTTTQADATVVAGAGSHINVERPFTV